MTQHPALHFVDVRCATCGNSFSMRSTAQALSIDVCSNCHPAYTGEERAVASGDRIDRFNRRARSPPRNVKPPNQAATAARARATRTTCVSVSMS